MKSSELMIGDWVYRNSEPVMVLSVGDNDNCTVKMQSGRVCGEACSELNYIYLTKELLESNGFKLVGSATSYWKLETDSKYTILITACEKITIYKPCLYGYRRVVDEIEILCLHELQHLLKMCHIKLDWKL